MVVAQSPNSINLSGNLPKFLLTASPNEVITIKLKRGAEVILEEKYTPDADGTISIDYREVVNGLLSVEIPPFNGSIFEQTKAVVNLVAELESSNNDEESVTFTVVKGGVEGLADHSVFLKSNFLTWQPQVIEVKLHDPRFLTYFASESCSLKIKSYFNGGSEETDIAIPAVNKLYTFNLNYGHVADLFEHAPLYYDVSIINAENRLTFQQRYVYINTVFDNESIIVFENSLGGVDTIRLTGEVKEKNTAQVSSALFDEYVFEYASQPERAFTINSGYFKSERERKWSVELINSSNKYYILDGSLVQVYSDKPEIEDTKGELSFFEITLLCSKKTRYLNLARQTNALPELTINTDTDQVFFLAPRLNELPWAESLDVLLPVQFPYENFFRKVSLASLILGSGDGGVDLEIDPTVPAHVKSITLAEKAKWNAAITAGDLANYFTIPQIESILLGSPLMLGYNKLQWDQAFGWGNHAGLYQPKEDQRLGTNDDVTHRSIKSTNYQSGATGAGFKLDENGNAEVESLTVRRELNVNVLNIREITGNGGSLAITNTAKIEKVFDMPDHWACHINTDDGNLTVQLRANDIVRCQIWDGKKMKYYSARVRAVSAGTFDLDKSSKVGAGVPEAGDMVFQFGNTADATRQGLIYLTNSDTGAPYIDVLDGVNSDNLAGKTKVRIGKLDGIYDPDLGPLSGYGLYGDNVAVKGKIVITGGNAQTIAGSAALANAAQDNATLIAANDATTKASSAQAAATANANGYTDTKAIATIGAAQTYADSVAISKANAAQANAILVAANDATAKQIAAEATAQAMVNAVKVGGRNMFLGSKKTVTTIGYGVGACPIADTAFSGNTYTISFRAKISNFKRNGLFFGYIIDVGTSVGVVRIDAQTFDYNLQVGSNFDGVIVGTMNFPVCTVDTVLNNGFYIDTDNCDSFEFSNPKLEKGTKSTDWTPAPEDVDAAVSAANAAAVAAQNANNALAASLKSMAYKDVVQMAELGNTVIQGGKLVNTLIDTIYLKANVANVDHINGLDLTFNEATINNIKARTINAAEIIVAGGGATQAYAQGLVNAIKIGGRNLIPNSSFENGRNLEDFYNVDQALVEVYGDIYPKYGKQFLISYSTNAAVGVYYFSTNKFNVLPNTEYTFSFAWMIGYSHNYLNVQVCFNYGDTETHHQYSFIAQTDRSWGERGKITFTTPSNVKMVRFRFDVYSTVWFALDGLKLEQGNKATDWTPAPEDVDAAVTAANNAAIVAQNANTALAASLKAMAYKDVVELAELGTTIIQGGKIKTTLLDADYIKASIINAAYITALDIVATKVAAVQGFIGGFNIVNQSLIAGSNSDNPTSWDLNSSNIRLFTGYQLFRKIGGTTEQTDELSINLNYYAPSAGLPYKDTLVIKNNIRNTSYPNGGAENPYQTRSKNRALVLEARNSDENIALEVMSGHVYLRGVIDRAGAQYGVIDGYIKKWTQNGMNYLVLESGAPPLNQNIPDEQGLYWNDEQVGYATYQGCSGFTQGSEHQAVVQARSFSSPISKAMANSLAASEAQSQADLQAQQFGYCYDPF